MRWDTRPNPKFGTVEIRICDLLIRFNDILAIAGVIHANKWQAAMHGLDGQFLDPGGYLGSTRIPFREAVKRILSMVDPMNQRLGLYHYVEGLNRILTHGTGSGFLREKYNLVNDFKGTAESIQGEFWK